MKAKNLFLLKALGSSLVLFVVWMPLSKFYGLLFDIGLRSISPSCQYFMKQEWLYRNSMYLIPLISLVLATPRVVKFKKTVIIMFGIFLIIVLDSIRVRFEIGFTGPSTVYAVYHTLKLLLPLTLWVLMCLPDLGRILDEQIETTRIPLFTCPICGADHGDILEHIKEIHGQRSLRFKKVRKFLAKNQEILA